MIIYIYICIYICASPPPCKTHLLQQKLLECDGSCSLCLCFITTFQTPTLQAQPRQPAQLGHKSANLYWFLWNCQQKCGFWCKKLRKLYAFKGFLNKIMKTLNKKYIYIYIYLKNKYIKENTKTLRNFRNYKTGDLEVWPPSSPAEIIILIVFYIFLRVFIFSLYVLCFFICFKCFSSVCQENL